MNIFTPVIPVDGVVTDKNDMSNVYRKIRDVSNAKIVFKTKLRHGIFHVPLRLNRTHLVGEHGKCNWSLFGPWAARKIRDTYGSTYFHIDKLPEGIRVAQKGFLATVEIDLPG